MTANSSGFCRTRRNKNRKLVFEAFDLITVDLGNRKLDVYFDESLINDWIDRLEIFLDTHEQEIKENNVTIYNIRQKLS